MRYVDTWVRVRHPCPFCKFSARYPEAEMTLWLSVITDIFQVSIPVFYDVDRIIESGKEMLLYTEEFHDEGSAMMLLNHPFIEEIDSVVAIASDTNCILIPPITFHDGWETHHLICKDQESLRRLVDKVSERGEIEVLSQKGRDHGDLMRDINIVPTHFIEGLTDKQVSALVNSYEAGLYDVPARTKMDAIATCMGMSRSTFGEHLRKAELQVMRNLYPFLKLRCCRDLPECAGSSCKGP